MPISDNGRRPLSAPRAHCDRPGRRPRPSRRSRRAAPIRPPRCFPHTLARRRTKSLKQSSADRTGGNRDAWRIAPGAEQEVFRAEGPGIISHIWFTIAAQSDMHLKELVLRACGTTIRNQASRLPLAIFSASIWVRISTMNPPISPARRASRSTAISQCRTAAERASTSPTRASARSAPSTRYRLYERCRASPKTPLISTHSIARRRLAQPSRAMPPKSISTAATIRFCGSSRPRPSDGRDARCSPKRFRMVGPKATT